MTNDNVIPLRPIHCAVHLLHHLLIHPDDHDRSTLTAVDNAVADLTTAKTFLPRRLRRHVDQIVDHRSNPDQLVHAVQALAEAVGVSQTAADERSRQQRLF